MNSQIVAINQAVRSKNTFYLITSLIPVSLFFNAGFISVTVIWFFALCLYNHTPLRARVRNYYLLFFPIAYFLLNIFWMTLSPEPTVGFDLLLREVHLLLIPLGFIVVDKEVTDKQLHTILMLFLAACLMSTLFCLMNAMWNVLRFEGFVVDGSHGAEHHLTYFKLAGPMDIPPTYFTMFCNWAFFITLRTSYLSPALKAVFAVYLAVFIFLLSTTVGIVSLVVITTLWLQTTAYRKTSRYVIGLALVIGLVIGLSKLSSGTNRAVLDKHEQYGDHVNSISARLVIWSYAWETIKRKPIIGYGLGGGQRALEQTYQRNGFAWGTRASLNAHSEFLSTFLDLGILGVFTVSVMLLLPLVHAIRAKDFMTLAFIAMMFVFFCFESVLLRQKGIVFFSFFYSVLFAALPTKATST